MEPARTIAGSQTLARGLRALELVAVANDGMTIQEVADRLGVHRSIASRLLATLADFHFVMRSADGRFHLGAGVVALATGAHSTLRAVAGPIMRDLAAELDAVVALVIAEGEEALPLAMVDPPNAEYSLSYRTGTRSSSLLRGSTGAALRSVLPPRADDEPAVVEARERGYAHSFSEVVEGAYGIAAPLHGVTGLPPTCLNVVTYRADVAEAAPAPLLKSMERLAAALR